ncbi:MAG: M48 family metalloprotease [Saprospiraceae bacterium]
MYQHKFPPILWLCIIYVMTIAASCEDDLQIGTRPQDFTKEMREELGELLSATIVVNSTQFPIVPETAPFDSAYWYLQTLYDQVTERAHADRSSMESKRWSPDRPWKVHIINDDRNQNAFAVPGGDFFITTGLLKSIDKEYEIYYIMAFESQLMDSRQLLNRLITEYSSVALDHLIEQRSYPNAVTANIIASELPSLIFDEGAVAEVDELSVAEICTTSIFDRLGVVEIIEDGAVENWLDTKNYAGRAVIVPQLQEAELTDCGVVKSNGTYRRFVLNKLP